MPETPLTAGRAARLAATRPGVHRETVREWAHRLGVAHAPTDAIRIARTRTFRRTHGADIAPRPACLRPPHLTPSTTAAP